MEYRNLADWLTAARERRLMTQSQAAAWFGCSDRTIRGWEKGTRPLACFLPKLAKFIDVPLASVMRCWKAGA